MQSQIDRKINEKKKEIVELTKTLVSIPTQVPPGENYDKIVNMIKREFGSKFKTRVYYSNKKPNLVVRWDVNSKRTLHINGHYDVVPVTPNWKYKPFEPVVKSGKLFGRGSKDMKSGLVAMIYAAKILEELRLNPTCNIELSFTCDEEIGGEDGLGFLVRNKLIKPDYAIVMDGSADSINNAHKGNLTLEIKVIGKASHAVYPHKGINAFTGACKLAEEINKLNFKLKKIKSELDTEEEIEKSPTIVLGGKTSGGNKSNTVPGEFVFTIDRRVIPEESIKNAKKQIIGIVNNFQKNNPQYKIIIKTLLEAGPSYVDKNAKICRIFFESARRVRKNVSFALRPGFLDMRFFVNDAKIDCINYGTAGDNIHGDDEFVYVNSIFESIKILIFVMLNKELSR